MRITIVLVLFASLALLLSGTVRAQQCSTTTVVDVYDCVRVYPTDVTQPDYCEWRVVGQETKNCDTSTCLTDSICSSNDAQTATCELKLLFGGGDGYACAINGTYAPDYVCSPASCTVGTNPTPSPGGSTPTPTSVSPPDDCTFDCEPNDPNRECLPNGSCSTGWACRDTGCPPPATPTPTSIPSSSCPTNLSVMCGNVGSDIVATFNWTETSGADRYILRVNREDGEDPEWVSTNDHWYYIDDVVGSCNGTNCTALLDTNTPKNFIQGDYLGWSVQAYDGIAGEGVSGCQVEGGPFSCTMPDGNFAALCTPDQEYGSLSYTFSIDTITNASNPLTYATFFLNTNSNQAYADDLRNYLGSPTWTNGEWQGYFVGRSYSLTTTNPPTIEYIWSESTSGTLGSNSRSINDLAEWMQSNYPGVTLEFGANLKYNNVQNDSIGSVSLSITPSGCIEREGWGVDNVSVCWDGSVLGSSRSSTQYSDVQVRRVNENYESKQDSLINKILLVLTKIL